MLERYLLNNLVVTGCWNTRCRTVKSLFKFYFFYYVFS